MLKCARYGVPHHEIAILIGVATETLLLYYRAELDRGKAAASEGIGGKLYNMAMRGNTAAAIFFAKAQMGWREKEAIDLADKLADIIGSFSQTMQGMAFGGEQRGDTGRAPH